MHSYPLYLDLSGRTCLVVGGGRVGRRKAIRLLSAGARVRIVEPSPSDALRGLGENPACTIFEREFEDADLDGVFLVFVATGIGTLNDRLAGLCRKRNLLCNVADLPERSDFILPAEVRQGDLSIAVSTEGASPALSRKLRMDLEAIFDGAYAPYVRILREIRALLLSEGHDPDGHRDLFRELVNGPLLSAVRNRDVGEAVAGLPDALRDRREVESLIRTVLIDS